MADNFSNQDLLQVLHDSVLEENAGSIFGTNDESMNQTVRRWDGDGEYDSRNKLYTDLLSSYIAIYTEKAKQKDEYKLVFFIITMVLFILLVAVGIGIISYVAVSGTGSISDIGAVAGGVAGIISALLVVPKIIAEHLFPVDEERTMIEMVKGMQENDAKIRDIMSKQHESE